MEEYVKKYCPEDVTAAEEKTSYDDNLFNEGEAIIPFAAGTKTWSTTAEFYALGTHRYDIIMTIEWGWNASDVITYALPSTSVRAYSPFTNKGLQSSTGPTKTNGGKTWSYTRKAKYFDPQIGNYGNPQATFNIDGSGTKIRITNIKDTNSNS